MRDVLARLMEWIETSDVDDAHITVRDAITEIAGLRARLEDYRREVREQRREIAGLREERAVLFATDRAPGSGERSP